MKEFTFYEYERIEVYARLSFSIKADSQEEAESKFLELLDSGDVYEHSNNDYHILDDTSYIISKEYHDEYSNVIRED